MFKLRAIIISFFIILNCVQLNAESFLNMNYNFSKSNSFQYVSNLSPDFFCYNNFSEISSLNRGASLGYIQRINSWYLIGASIGYTDNFMDFSAYDKVKIGIDGEMLDGVILSRINTNSALYSFKLDFGIFEIYENFFLTTAFSYTGSGKTVYNKYEQLVEPVNQGVFQETQTRIRNQSEGTMDQVFQSYGLSASARYLIPVYAPINSEDILFLAPEVEFCYSLSKFYQSEYWRTKTIKLIFGLQYRF